MRQLRGVVGLIPMALSAPLLAAGPSPGQPVESAVVSDGTDEAISRLDTVTVTGTRISGTGFEAPAPITSVDAEDLRQSSPSTLAAALNNLPALVATGGPNESVGQQGSGRNSMNLRGIGVGRTLTLVNGRRFPGSAANGAVDTNLIPQALVQKVEIVTGGASAAYGSDAVAGVVNFVLNDQYEGTKFSASTGMSERGDGAENRASVLFGRHFKGGDTQLVVSGEWYRNDGIDGDARAFRRNGANLIPNPLVSRDNPASAENPALIAVPNARINSTFGGLIVGATGGSAAARNGLIGTQFLANGVPAPFDYGSLGSASAQNGGDGVNPAVLQRIVRPLERATAYVGLNSNVTEDLRFFANAGFGWSRSNNSTVAYHSGRDAITIRADNAFLPAEIRDLMNAGQVTAITMNRHDGEYSTTVHAENRNYRAEAGFKGVAGRFDYEASVQVGYNRETAPNTFNYLRSAYTQGIDSVMSGGVPVCRVTLTDPSSACVPINPFGPGSYSEEAIGYFTDTSV